MEIVMKFIGYLIVLSVLTFSVSSFADYTETNGKKQLASVDSTGLDTVLDIPLRLGGLVTTLVGTGLFIGTSPFTGLMTAIRPHNAIQKTAEYLVVRPGVYTFVRPTGDFYYDSRPNNEK
jgi:hypothetical protein